MPKYQAPPRCLHDLIEHLVEEMQLQDQYDVEVQVDRQIGFPCEPTQLRTLLRSLVEQATASMADTGELAFIAWESAEVCELEVSDSGIPIEDRRRLAPPSMMSATQVEYDWANCPQGGGAVTARFAKHAIMRHAA